MLSKPYDMSCITKLLDAKVDQCPHCQCNELDKWGTSGNRQRYRCKSCRRTFNVLTGTELNAMYHQDKWEHYVETMLEGAYLRKAAKECGIALSTSFRWRHKCLKLTDKLTDQRLEGIVEIDETYFNLSEKGSRVLNRKARKRGTDNHAWLRGRLFNGGLTVVLFAMMAAILRADRFNDSHLSGYKL